MSIIAAFVAGLILAGSLAFALNIASRPIPACEEDAVLVGTGNFDGQRYDAYECGPAYDDVYLPGVRSPKG